MRLDKFIVVKIPRGLPYIPYRFNTTEVYVNDYSSGRSVGYTDRYDFHINAMKLGVRHFYSWPFVHRLEDRVADYNILKRKQNLLKYNVESRFIYQIVDCSSIDYNYLNYAFVDEGNVLHVLLIPVQRKHDLEHSEMLSHEKYVDEQKQLTEAGKVTDAIFELGEESIDIIGQEYDNGNKFSMDGIKYLVEIMDHRDKEQILKFLENDDQGLVRMGISMLKGVVDGEESAEVPGE